MVLLPFLAMLFPLQHIFVPYRVSLSQISDPCIMPGTYFNWFNRVYITSKTLASDFGSSSSTFKYFSKTLQTCIEQIPCQSQQLSILVSTRVPPMPTRVNFSVRYSTAVPTQASQRSNRTVHPSTSFSASFFSIPVDLYPKSHDRCYFQIFLEHL